MTRLIALLMVFGLLSACVVDNNHHGHEKGGDFCPPGQAKKGNC